MYCSKCGKELPDDTKFCPDCGQDLSAGGKLKEAAAESFQSVEKEVTSAVKEVQDSFNGSTNQNGNSGTGGNGTTPPYTGERLKDDRGLVSYILLSIITCNIYSYYFLYKMAHDVNIACDGDGENTPGLVELILLSMITCGVYAFYWYYKLGNRLAANAPRYGMSFQENGTTVLLWDVLGSALCGIGPFVAMHILITNSNKICGAYNRSKGL